MTDTGDTKKNPNILITGGSGFLGKRIVDELTFTDSPVRAGLIRVFDTKAYDGSHADKIQFMQGEIRNLEEVKEACNGMDIVIHSAAIIDWGTKSETEVLAVNVEGTKNVIKACKDQGVKHLVFTSSLDAVFTGKPLINIDETQPYPNSHHTIYCKSKKLAEIEMVEANNEKLHTCILRPSDIYGEADPYHIDSLIGMARTGFYVRLGNGKSVCQHVYVGNMAYAHIQAAAALWNGNKSVRGNIYFITDGKGANFFKFFDQVVAGAGYKIFPKNLWMPKRLAYLIGSISELMALLIRPIKKYNPGFSRFAVTYTCTDFIFNSKKAETDFGFSTKYSAEEALKNTIAYYSNTKNNPKSSE